MASLVEPRLSIEKQFHWEDIGVELFDLEEDMED